MAGVPKLAVLLDDPEIRDLLLGLGSPAHLHTLVLGLAGTVRPEQYASWLSDDTPNLAMTPEQVRAAVGDGRLGDLAAFSGADPGEVAWQLAGVLPDLVDAVSPGGTVAAPAVLAAEIADAGRADDRETGPFGRLA